MESFEESLKQEFLTEAREMLEDVESKFLELERNPNDKSIMDYIFRLAHTVKGSAFAAGFEGLGSFAHTFETLLNLLRDGKMEASNQIVDLLLRSNDTLRKFVEALTDDNNATLNVENITAELLEAIGDEGGKKWDGPAFGFFDDDNSSTVVQTDTAKPISAASVVAEPEARKSANVVSMSPTLQANIAATSPTSANPLNTVNLSSVLNPKILICDDEADIIELASDILKQIYPVLTVLTAKDGNEALEVIKLQKPHVIVTDLKMPNLNGVDFIRKVRAHDENVPVVFFSGFADRNNMIEFIKLGVVDFHDKPLDVDRFGLSISNALKLVQTREGIIKLSTLNFKAYMSILKMSQFKPEQKAESDDLAKKVKIVLDEVALISNYIMGL